MKGILPSALSDAILVIESEFYNSITIDSMPLFDTEKTAGYTEIPMKSFPGKISANIYEVRFAFSGKVIYVSKTAGDLVKKWEVIASLDRKPLQAELDQQLSDYERVRAEFEIFNIKEKGGDDITKFLKQEKQAALNASVKQVEVAKIKLDQADLVSPIDGIVLESDNLLSGLNVTPANAAVKLLDPLSLAFCFTIAQKELHDWKDGQEITIRFEGIKEGLHLKTEPIHNGDNGKFPVVAKIPPSVGLLPGMVGEAKVIG
jgi:multidrug resistance efflux pump